MSYIILRPPVLPVKLFLLPQNHLLSNDKNKDNGLGTKQG